MFLSSDELKSVIYEYQLTEITESDSDIPEMAISAAVEEMKSYLRPGKTSENRYDVEAIFSKEGDQRNPLILELCKSIALYYVCRLSNVDIIEEKVKERYDRAIAWLEKVAGISTETAINPDLPTITPPEDTAGLPCRSGSRDKFNHE